MKKLKFYLMIACIAVVSGSSQLKSSTKTTCTVFPDPPTLGWTVADFQNFNDYPPHIQPCMGGWILRIIDWLGLGPKNGGGAQPSFDWYNCVVSPNVFGKTCHASPAAENETLICSHSCSTSQPCVP